MWKNFKKKCYYNADFGTLLLVQQMVVGLAVSQCV